MPPQPQRAPSPEYVTAFFKKQRIYLLAIGFTTAVMFSRLQLCGAAPSESLSEEDLSKIDSYIETQLQEADIPGAALVIVERDQITMALKVDREVKMGIVVDVQQELKEVNARKILYSATKRIDL